MRTSRLCRGCLAALIAASTAAASDRQNDKAASPATTRPAADRSFLFTYAATLAGLRPGQSVRVWLPVPPTDDTQSADLVTADLPAPHLVLAEPRFGNRVLSFPLPADHAAAASFALTYRVTRHAVAGPSARCPIPTGAAMCDTAALLRPDARVPVGGKPAQVLLAGRSTPADPTESARQLYDIVDDHLQYRKDRPGWGTGDAAWACTSGFGNCTDFHSLFISLARTRRLPAVFQIGFPVADAPAGDVKGYHCWAWVHAATGWSPVDISEANLHPEKRAFYFGHLDSDRVAFTVGRDLDLIPPQAGPPLNFFVYPYVEVDGRPLPQAEIAKTFSYRPAP